MLRRPFLAPCSCPVCCRRRADHRWQCCGHAGARLSLLSLLRRLLHAAAAAAAAALEYILLAAATLLSVQVATDHRERHRGLHHARGGRFGQRRRCRTTSCRCTCTCSGGPDVGLRVVAEEELPLALVEKEDKGQVVHLRRELETVVPHRSRRRRRRVVPFGGGQLHRPGAAHRLQGHKLLEAQDGAQAVVVVELHLAVPAAEPVAARRRGDDGQLLVLRALDQHVEVAIEAGVHHHRRATPPQLPTPLLPGASSALLASAPLERHSL